MNGWTIAGFLSGWIFGVWMSYRKVLKERVARSGLVGARLYELLKDYDVINVTVTEEGEDALTELNIDIDKLDELLGNKPTKH